MEGRTTQKRAPLTAAEKQYRRENDLCLYCGDPGQKISDCPRCLTNWSNGTNASDPETALPQEPVLRPGASGATSTNPKKTGFSDLPREIRDKIYEEHFCLDEFEIQQTRSRIKLDVSILRVSRQLFREASETLYESNGWITATVTDRVLNLLAWENLNSIFGLPAHKRSVTRYENDLLSNSAILHMDLRQDTDSSLKKTNLVVPLAAMPRFCRIITQSSWVDYTTLLLHFNPDARVSHQVPLLGYLGQARGLRNVGVPSFDLTWPSLNTILLMTHPYTRLAEIQSTMYTYQERSENELTNGQTLLARNIIQDGVDFVDWWSDRMRGKMAQFHPLEDGEIDILFETRADMGFSSSSLSLRVGNIESAQVAVQHVLQRLDRDDRLATIHKARAHYHMAQTFEALGLGNAALYSYLQALRLRPGYSEADAAVDKMEQNLGFGSALEDARVKHNIDHVLSHFRSRHEHSTAMRDRDYDVIFRKFEGTAAEIRSVDRYAGQDTDLVYMNPQYRNGNDDDDDDDDN